MNCKCCDSISKKSYYLLNDFIYGEFKIRHNFRDGFYFTYTDYYGNIVVSIPISNCPFCGSELHLGG